MLYIYHSVIFYAYYSLSVVHWFNLCQGNIQSKNGIAQHNLCFAVCIYDKKVDLILAHSFRKIRGAAVKKRRLKKKMLMLPWRKKWPSCEHRKLNRRGASRRSTAEQTTWSSSELRTSVKLFVVDASLSFSVLFGLSFSDFCFILFFRRVW